MMFSFAWRWSSLTQDFALSRDDCRSVLDIVQYKLASEVAYGLGDIIDYHSTICVSVVHGCQRFVSFLSCRIPYLELNCCIVV